jgi:hypothetical protein
MVVVVHPRAVYDATLRVTPGEHAVGRATAVPWRRTQRCAEIHAGCERRAPIGRFTLRRTQRVSSGALRAVQLAAWRSARIAIADLMASRSHRALGDAMASCAAVRV